MINIPQPKVIRLVMSHEMAKKHELANLTTKKTIRLVKQELIFFNHRQPRKQRDRVEFTNFKEYFILSKFVSFHFHLK
jgi:hypothetical protein